MGEAADRFLGEQAPSPHKFLLRISEQRDILVRASSLRPIPAPPPFLRENKNKSPVLAKCILLGEPAASPHRGCKRRGSPRGWGWQRGAVCVLGGVKHSQNSSILPAPVGAGAAAAAAEVRGNTAP